MQQKKTNGPALLALAILAGAFGFWLRLAAHETTALYDEQAKILGTTAIVVDTVEVEQTKVVIPSWSLFKDGELWSLVSKVRQLSNSFAPTLVDSPVEHTSGNFKIAKQIEQPLKELFIAAEKDNVKLMLSSAYRSPEDQQKIYDSYKKMYGAEYVASYVTVPGSSEHQTGLSVDVSTKTNECLRAANACSLDFESIAWLNKNASTFGFIQRYPSGKQSITGIAGETWHYRYVGKVLATALDTSGMTLDEFVQQAAPAYAR